jgi:hypothetical protein
MFTRSLYTFHLHQRYRHHHHHLLRTTKRTAKSVRMNMVNDSNYYYNDDDDDENNNNNMNEYNNNYDDDDINLSKSRSDRMISMKQKIVTKETSQLLRRVSWFSWWAQVILTTVSAVILVFAQNVFLSNTTTVLRSQQQNRSNYTPLYFSGIGLFVSAASIVWTWANGARLSQRLIRGSYSSSMVPVPSVSKIRTWIQRTVGVGIRLNLVGLACHLIAAEQIVGVLAVKVLTTFGSGGGTAAGVANTNFFLNIVQPLDILIVQANTNALFSHFVSLVSLLYIQQQARIIRRKAAAASTVQKNIE